MVEIKATHIQWQESLLTREERWTFLKTRGCTLWLTGLPSSGKSTIASALELELVRRGRNAFCLDGDNIRHGLNKNLGFSREDRAENIRRIGEVARLFAESGSICITAFISPYLSDRAGCRAMHEQAGLPFLEIHVDTPLAICEERDPKGLYKKARAGQLKGFTGVDDPYEPPPSPEAVLQTAGKSVEQCVGQLIELLSKRGLLNG